MNQTTRLSIAFALFLLLAASCPGGAPVAARPRRPAAMILSPELEAQVQRIERLSNARLPGGAPDPHLFDALARLEEMIPRSAATRRAQEAGKRAYTAMVTRKSVEMAQRWPALRASIERLACRDAAYQRALAALDARLQAPASGGSSGTRNAGQGQTTLAAIPFDQMRPGDVMLWDDRSGPPMVRVALALFARKCTHSALYLGETSSRGRGVQRWTLEAQSPALGVRSAVMGAKWLRRGLHVSLGHVSQVTPARAAQLAAAAIATYGADGRTPYHIWPPWDKTYYHEGLYCSQLLWTVYQKGGVDLDSNDWHYLAWFTVHNWFNPYAAPTAYFAVFPDEIKTSPHITWYYDQVNR